MGLTVITILFILAFEYNGSKGQFYSYSTLYLQL
jgi:hypothetical protein